MDQLMIDGKINILESKIAALEKEIDGIKNRDCHGKLETCEYSRMFYEFTQALHEEITPLQDLIGSLIDENEENEIAEERIEHVLPLMVMFMSNIQNRILLTLQESISNIGDSNDNHKSDMRALQENFDSIVRSLNRVKIMVSKHDIFQ